MIVRELVTRLGFAVNDGQMKKYETGVNNIKNSAEGAANAFRNMFAAFVGFSLLKSIGNTADEMTSLQARVGQLPQTIGTAADSFDEIAKRASSARQAVGEYATFYVKAASATQDFLKNQADVLDVVDGVAFGLAASQAPIMQQKQAFFQLGQAIGSPVVQMEEMNTLIDTAPELFRDLGKAIPGAEGNLKKFISTGKVTGKMLAEGLIKVMPKFRDKMLEIPIGMDTAMLLGENRWKMFIHRLNRESGATTSIAKFLLIGFDKIEEGLEKIVDFFGGATQAVKFFGIALLSALAPFAAAGIWSLIMSPMTLLIAGLILLGVVLEDVYQFFTGGESVIGDFVEWLNSGTIAAGTMKGVLIALGVVLGALAVGFTAAWLAAAGPITLIIVGLMALYGAFLYFKDEVSKIMSDLWDSITGGFNSMIEGLKSAWTGFKSFFTGGVNANVSASTVAGAAVSSGGVGGTRQSTTNNTINQTLPPGSTPEMAEAARAGTEKALQAADNGALARQMGQAQ